MTTRFKLRRDLASTWVSTNPVLAAGEPGLETDTRKVKYGDGVTHWNALDYGAGVNDANTGDLAVQWTDGVNTNTWRIVEVQGSKAFDYVTPGHQYIVVPAVLVTDSTSITVNLSGQNTTDLELSMSYGSSIYIYFNGGEGANNRLRVDVTKNGTNFTFDTTNYGGTTFSAATTDRLNIEYWHRGTQYQYDNWGEENDMLSENTATATNTLVFDNARYENSNINDFLTQNVTKHKIIFNDYFNEDARAITNVTKDGDIFTLTFSGAPRAVEAPSLKTLTTTANNSGTDSTYMLVSQKSNPGLTNIIYNYQNYSWQNQLIGAWGKNVRVTINNGSPILGYTYGQGNVTSHGNYEIYLDSNATWTATDVITIEYIDAGTTFDLDYYVSDSNWVGLNDGYRWFNWQTDLGQTYVNAMTNGVQAAKMTVHFKVYSLEDHQAGSSTLLMDFVGGNNYFEPRDMDGNRPYNYTPLDGYVFNDFDEKGIAFASWFGGYGSSRTLKVRIMYRMELVIGEDNNNENDWTDC